MMEFGVQLDSKFGRLKVLGQLMSWNRLQMKAAFCGDRKLTRRQLRELESDPRLLEQARRGYLLLKDSWNTSQR